MGLIIRRPRIEEIEALKQIHEPYSEEFKFPNIDKLESIYVCVENEIIVGFGALQLIYEATIVLNKDINMWNRLAALDLLQARAEDELRSMDVVHLHAFVQNKKFENLLRNRLGYISTKGNALVKVIDNAK